MVNLVSIVEHGKPRIYLTLKTKLGTEKYLNLIDNFKQTKRRP